MKLKGLAILVLCFLGSSSAFAQKTPANPVSLGFLSYDETTQYCDYEVLTVTGPVATGVHNIQDQGCSVEDQNGVMTGVLTDIPASTGLPITGPVYVMADNTGDAFIGSGGGFACGCAFLYITKLKPATKQELQSGGPFGWAFYYTFGGESALGSYGFLTKQLGSSNGVDSFGVYLK